MLFKYQNISERSILMQPTGRPELKCKDDDEEDEKHAMMDGVLTVFS
jgi:hypothetical protein